MMTLLQLDIRADHPAFAGHFPEDAIVPGVVLLDESLQAVAAHLDIGIGGCTIVSAKFVNPARPGEPILLEFERRDDGRVQVELRSGERPLASALIELPAGAAGR